MPEAESNDTTDTDFTETPEVESDVVAETAPEPDDQPEAEADPVAEAEPVAPAEPAEAPAEPEVSEPQGITFADLGLRPELFQALDELGYEEPTPIQAEAIRPMIAGHDLLAQAATGTATAGSAIRCRTGEPRHPPPRRPLPPPRVPAPRCLPHWRGGARAPNRLRSPPGAPLRAFPNSGTGPFQGAPASAPAWRPGRTPPPLRRRDGRVSRPTPTTGHVP